MSPEPMTLLGVGPRILALGRLAVRADWPVVGIWGRPHRRALEATLLLGCPAFPDPCEPVADSRLVLMEEADDGLLRRVAPALGEGVLVGHLGPEGPLSVPSPGHPLAMHVLEDLPDLSEDRIDLAGGLVLLEGSPAALERGARLVRALGGRPRAAGRLQCLQALAARALVRRGQSARASRLWSEAGLEAGGLFHPAPRPTDGTGAPESGACRLWPGEGHQAVSCEDSLAVVVRLLRDLDPQAARLLEEIEGEP